MSKISGYSLYELVMTLGLVAVVLTLGIPSFSKITADHRLRTEVNALFHNVHLARKESLTRRRAVTLCPSLDGLSCGPANGWSAGWIRFVNTDRDQPPVRDPGEAILLYHEVSAASRIEANRPAFTLRGTRLRATNGTLIVCDRNNQADPRALVISHTGRPRVARSDYHGQPYACRN
jgi:type IV fimbrial biogenesis protein FimT